MGRMLSKKMLSAALGSIAISSLVAPTPAMAQAEPFLGQLAVFGSNFCPNGWAEAAGQIISIAQNTALFSLLGVQYGGNGTSTFALPDLRGRAAIGAGQGPGLSPFDQGQNGGQETVTIGIVNMPPHNHPINATNAAATKGGPGGKFLAAGSSPTADPKYSDTSGITNTATTSSTNVVMNAGMVGSTGGGQPISVRDPYLALKWCIATSGIFPSRP